MGTKNIKNFLNTLQEFDFDQLYLIYSGLEQGLDVKHYANPNFTNLQMKEIKLGLENNLDISIYASEEFDNKQMYYIRDGLMQGLDVTHYAKPELSWQEMKKELDKIAWI